MYRKSLLFYYFHYKALALCCQECQTGGLFVILTRMNQLQNKADFEAVLQKYQLSNAAQKLLHNMKFVLLVGPSSSGRNTIINELLKSGHYHDVVSDTTRSPRENNGIMEQNGVEYWFRSEQDILADLKKGAFLEAAIIHGQQVSGISMRELETAAGQGKVAINEIEVVGADNVHAAAPNTIFLFILPPSFDEWMTRMQSRGKLPPEEVKRRLQSAVSELQIALDRDYFTFVVNNTFKHTAETVDMLITNKQESYELQHQNGRAVAEQLLADTTEHLKNL